MQQKYPQGLLSLREAISRHLAASQIFAGPERICIVSGSQQALHLLVSMPFPNGKSAILLEQPGYAGMNRAVSMLGATAIGIARTDAGIDLEELERHFRSNPIKFFYTVPRYHNPLGTSLSRHHKEAIARLAAKYDVYVVEDDYLADIEQDSKADPIFSYDRSDHVIYIRSFSKIMLPGLRLGTAVVPAGLMTTFRTYKASADSSTSALSQAALEVHLGSGLFQRHAVMMRDRYGVRMKALREAFVRYLPEGFRPSMPEGGLFAHLELPERVPAEDLAAVLRRSNVTVLPTPHFFLPSFAGANGIRLSVIRTNEEEIEAGIRLIGMAAEEILSGQTAKLSQAAFKWI
jgi:DNA-binding transcriptional MocR family regulator